MPSPAELLYNSLRSIDVVRELISEGEAEGQYLECKAPSSPQLDKGLKGQLAVALSGFANSGGGVVLIGVSTDSKLHHGLDVLTQVEPIGTCAALGRRIDRAIPMLVTPAVPCPPCRILREKAGDTKGIAALFVPATNGDPVQCLFDTKFYIRVAAESVEMPYATLKRMFAGSEAPDLSPVFDGRLVSKEQDGSWRIPLLVENRSSRSAAELNLTVTILNPEACETIAAEQLIDASQVNPGKRMFIGQVREPVHRGLNHILGALRIGMKKGKRDRRVLNLGINIYCSGMRARKWKMRVQLAKSGFSVTRTADEFLY